MSLYVRREDSMMFEHSYAIRAIMLFTARMMAAIPQRLSVILACNISKVVQVKGHKGRVTGPPN